MKKSKSEINGNLVIFSVAVIVLSAIIIFLNFSRQQGQQNLNQQKQNQFNRQNCLADDCLDVDGLEYPVGDLPQTVKDALGKALDDEYKAYSTYEAVINKFGNIRPFFMIIRAEEQHIASLKAIYDKYGLNIPLNNWSKKIVVPETVREACGVGVEAEIDNAALYKNDLLPVVSDYEDITVVFQNLMSASEKKHLPAFEKCD